MKTIIFITIYPLNEDYALKYGFEILKKRGFNIVILNIMHFIFKKNIIDKIPHYNILNPVGGIEQISIKSEKALTEHLNNIARWKIAVLITFPYIKLLYLLKRTETPYIKTFTNVHPRVETKFSEHFIDAIQRFIKNPISYIADSMEYRLSSAFYPPDHVILGAEASAYKIKSSKTKIIHAHSFDYDHYLRNKNKPKPACIPEGEYYVHIANHAWEVHDNILLGIKPIFSKDEYAALINSFFNFVEKHTGKKIIIAAYPKATEDENIYEGRPFLYETEQLIKFSSGVFCHYSGAIKFAVIHKKPICFISTRHFNESKYHRVHFMSYATALGADINSIDNTEHVNKLRDKGLFYYNKERYEDYAKKYISSDRSNERPLWDIVADTLIKDMASNE